MQLFYYSYSCSYSTTPTRAVILLLLLVQLFYHSYSCSYSTSPTRAAILLLLLVQQHFHIGRCMIDVRFSLGRKRNERLFIRIAGANQWVFRRILETKTNYSNKKFLLQWRVCHIFCNLSMVDIFLTRVRTDWKY